MRHLTLVALLGLLLGPSALWALNAEAHHVGNADYNEIGPCDEYEYNPDAVTEEEIALNFDLTECWNVHGGLNDDGLYSEPSENMTGPIGPFYNSGMQTE